jgi:soluble lytic murein transglycosylase-like protein
MLGTGGLSLILERFMRACVVVLSFAAVALVQPAHARKASHKASHHFTQHHHHAHQARHGYRSARLRMQRAPIIAGYAMPQSFARTESVDTPFAQGGWQGAPSRELITSNVSMRRAARTGNGAYDDMIARHAAANGLPVELVRRVVARESGGNARASNRGALGLMQIKHATARSLGYGGSASGLLDAETNLTYATRYLAGAYRAAGGNQSRAVALYASGYYSRGGAVARAPREVVVDAVSAQSMEGAPAWLRDDAMVMRGAR